MRMISAGEFKAKCLALMDEVYAGGETIVITKRGKPVAQLAPPQAIVSSRRRPLFGALQGQAVIVGDIVQSEHSEEEWERMADESWERATGDKLP
jgi:prevent-host-death family protein